MTDIVVRYEPGYRHPHSVWRNGLWQISFVQFNVALRVARSLNGGTLPRINTDEYAEMFPDRVCVYGEGDGEEWIIQRGTEDAAVHATHAAAMTAAHQLATETTGDKR